MKNATSQLRIGNAPLYHVVALVMACAPLHAQKLPLGATPPGKVALIVLSHHDDHTWEWGFGGFIAKLSAAGFTSYYVRTTNDEKDSGIGWGKGDQLNLRESNDAMRHLGVKEVISLNWRNDYMDSVPIKEVRAHFILLIRKLRPDVLLTWNPWGHYDRNPDHRKVSRAIGEAAWMAGLRNVHPEHLAASLEPYRVPQIYYTFRSDYGKGHEANIAIELTQEHVRLKGDGMNEPRSAAVGSRGETSGVDRPQAGS
jgi:LmbE family N-acetylglucosaminyl deacetylase